jgi:hypothetical protein
LTVLTNVCTLDYSGQRITRRQLPFAAQKGPIGRGGENR